MKFISKLAIVVLLPVLVTKSLNFDFQYACSSPSAVFFSYLTVTEDKVLIFTPHTVYECLNNSYEISIALSLLPKIQLLIVSII